MNSAIGQNPDNADLQNDDVLADNTSRLSSLDINAKETTIGKGYSRFVKSMRYLLPLIALALTVIVATWPEMDDKIVVIAKEELITTSQSDIGENELLNPRFETTDAQNQPVNITAVRALQNQENPNLVRLETPEADLQMSNGDRLNINANEGTYEQESEKLFLQNNVKILHESGYELQAEELRVDMKTQEAFSDKDVRIDGPDAVIEATGLDGNMDEGVLIFKGPATLTLHNNAEQNDDEITDQLNE